MHAYFAAAVLTPDWELTTGISWVVGNLRFGYESFFVLAGYFLAHSFRPGEPEVLSLAAFFRRRLLRLAVPFWVAVGLGVGWFLASAAVKGVDPHPGTRNLVPLLLFVHDLVPSGMPSAAYWFVAPLMQFYLLWGIGFWSVRRWLLTRRTPGHHDSALRVMIVLTGAALLASYGCVAAGVHPRWRLADNAVFLALGCFAYWRAAGLRVGLVFAAAVVGVTALGIYAGNSRLVASGVSTVLVSTIARHNFTVARRPVRALGLVGRWSYSIYLTHTYIVYRMANVPAVLDWSPTQAVGVGVWAAAIVASVGFGAVFYTLVERPLHRLSREVQYRREPPARADRVA
jgi:peptidoglycan/LPS O-acetylase OafA/YrhL